MALLSQVKGVGPKSGIFFLGAPYTFMAFDDGLVLLRGSFLSGLLAGQGAVGAGLAAAKDRSDDKQRAASGDTATAGSYSAHKRGTVVPLGDIGAVRLEPAKMGQRNVIVRTAGGDETKVRYPSKQWSDDEATAVLTRLLGGRFTNAL